MCGRVQKGELCCCDARQGRRKRTRRANFGEGSGRGILTAAERVVAPNGEHVVDAVHHTGAVIAVWGDVVQVEVRCGRGRGAVLDRLDVAVPVAVAYGSPRVPDIDGRLGLGWWARRRCGRRDTVHTENEVASGSRIALDNHVVHAGGQRAGNAAIGPSPGAAQAEAAGVVVVAKQRAPPRDEPFVGEEQEPGVIRAATGVNLNPGRLEELESVIRFRRRRPDVNDAAGCGASILAAAGNVGCQDHRILEGHVVGWAGRDAGVGPALDLQVKPSLVTAQIALDHDVVYPRKEVDDDGRVALPTDIDARAVVVERGVGA